MDGYFLSYRDAAKVFDGLSHQEASGKGVRYLFIFPRADAAKIEQIVEYLRLRLGQHALLGLESHVDVLSL